MGETGRRARRVVALTGRFMVDTAGPRAAGLALAMLLVPDLHTSSSGSAQVLAFLAVAAIFTTASPLLEALTFRMMDVSMRGASAAEMAYALEHAYSGVPAVDRRATRAGRGLGTVLGGWVFLFGASILVLWATVWLTELVGLPMRAPGWWATVVAALVVFAVQDLLGKLPDLLDERARERAVVRFWFFGSCWLGLWFVTLLPDAELASPSSSPAALTLAGYAAIFAFTMSSLEAGGLDVPDARFGMWAPVPIALNVVRLWMLSWLSGWMSQPLEIHGLWTFVLGGVIVRLTSSTTSM